MFHPTYRFGGGGGSPAGYYWTANNATLRGKNDQLFCYWPLGEASGNRVDSVGNYVMTENQGAGRRAGKYGYEPNWGQTHALVVPNANLDIVQLAATENFTLAFWFKATNENTDRYFINIGDMWDTGDGMCVWYRRNAEGTNPRKIQVRSYVGGVAGANFVSANNFDDGNWHHLWLSVAGTGANEWSLRIDNAAEGSGTGSCGDDGGDTIIGQDGTGSGKLATGNGFDELAMWDEALDTTYCSANYNSATGSFFVGKYS